MMDIGTIICVSLCSLIMLGGLSIIGVGSAAQQLYGDICQKELNLSAGYVAIILGCVIVVLMAIIITFSILKSYGSFGVIFLGFGFVMVLVAGGLMVYIWLNKANFINDGKVCITEYFTKYNANEIDEEVINVIQNRIKCCGIDGPESITSSPLPSSCCSPQLESCTQGHANIIDIACGGTLENLLEIYFPISFGILAGVCSIIIILILFTCYQMIKKSDEYLV